MTTCKECLHIAVCGRYTATGGNVRECKHFVTDNNVGNGARIRLEKLRAMTDEELAQWLARLLDGCGELRYCRYLPECDEDLYADREIPLERCEKCMLKWLREPGKLLADADDRESCGLMEET